MKLSEYTLNQDIESLPALIKNLLDGFGLQLSDPAHFMAIYKNRLLFIHADNNLCTDIEFAFDYKLPYSQSNTDTYLNATFSIFLNKVMSENDTRYIKSILACIKSIDQISIKHSCWIYTNNSPAHNFAITIS